MSKTLEKVRFLVRNTFKCESFTAMVATIKIMFAGMPMNPRATSKQLNTVSIVCQAMFEMEMFFRMCGEHFIGSRLYWSNDFWSVEMETTN